MDRENKQASLSHFAPSGVNLGGKAALRFIILLGFVSLFADVTYEGARSIIGPYLAVLGASATVVGVVAGSGELIGYALRFLSGLVADRTRRYWTITLIGYTINLMAVPLMGFAGRWELVAALIVAERAGKGLRTPARDAMLSHATKNIGHGWGFGLHEAMDQIGAVLGPLIAAIMLYLNSGYRSGFLVLFAPAALAILVLLIARVLYPRPQDLEVSRPSLETKGFSRTYWLYLAAVSLIAAGYADFALIAYHFEKVRFTAAYIPTLYALAMAADAIAALVFGRLYDRIGILVLIGSTLISAAFAPLVFLGGCSLAVLGMVLWGIGMGAQESVMRAAVANLVPSEKRGSGYGVFTAGYGIFWFLGSALMGGLYGFSIPALVVFSVAVQLASVPILASLRK